MMKISNEIADVLANSKIDGQALYLPGYQLDRKLYLSVNKVLEAIGGKWNRKSRSHIFDCYPEYKIEEILLTGEYTNVQKEYQLFETLDGLAVRLVKMADIQPRESVLEPNAGRGAIAKYIENCDCIELNPENRQYLIENGFNVVGDDFLKFNAKYDVIIANPPFQKQQDVSHITHMIKLANRCVVSVASASVMFRTNKKTENFRTFVDVYGGEIIPLPADSFKESGTRVNTCLVYINKA